MLEGVWGCSEAFAETDPTATRSSLLDLAQGERGVGGLVGDVCETSQHREVPR